MIVQTITGARGPVVRRSPTRIYVRLWLTLPGRGNTRGRQHPPANVIVAYAPQDVIIVKGQPNEC